MANLYPQQRSIEFHTFGAASSPSSVQQHIECPEPDESAKSNTNQKRTCRLLRGSNPNKLAESDESDESYTKKDLSDSSPVGLPAPSWTPPPPRPPRLACSHRPGRPALSRPIT